jgi:ABC-type antimicrobial peptide transport system permease subunit
MAPSLSVPNHLVGAIIATILGFFCYILPAVAGVVAIAYATQVNSKLQQGDHSGAVDASRKAMTWTWVSIGLMLAIVVVFIIGAIIWARSGDVRHQLNL